MKRYHDPIDAMENGDLPWDDEHFQMFHDAYEGLRDGNLEPLRLFIEQGYPIGGRGSFFGGQLAWAIAEAISGDGPFVLQLRGRVPNQKRESDTRKLHREKLEIGSEIRRRLQSDVKLKVNDAISDVARERGIGRTKAVDAYNMVKDQMSRPGLVPDWGDLMKLLPDEFCISSENVVSRRTK